MRQNSNSVLLPIVFHSHIWMRCLCAKYSTRYRDFHRVRSYCTRRCSGTAPAAFRPSPGCRTPRRGIECPGLWIPRSVPGSWHRGRAHVQHGGAGRGSSQTCLADFGGLGTVHAASHDIGNGATMFNWHQLKRWGIDESRLPPGSEVRFRPRSLWDQYRWRWVPLSRFCCFRLG